MQLNIFYNAFEGAACLIFSDMLPQNILRCVYW